MSSIIPKQFSFSGILAGYPQEVTHEPATFWRDALSTATTYTPSPPRFANDGNGAPSSSEKPNEFDGQDSLPSSSSCGCVNVSQGSPPEKEPGNSSSSPTHNNTNTKTCNGTKLLRCPVSCVFPEWQAERQRLPMAVGLGLNHGGPEPLLQCSSERNEGATDATATAANWFVPLAAALTEPKKKGTVRIVCVSDTHNYHKGLTDRIPPCDFLVHAGDFSDTGKKEDVEEFCRWLREDLPQVKYKIVIAGNHDLSLDGPTFYQRRHRDFGHKAMANVSNTAENNEWLSHELEMLKNKSTRIDDNKNNNKSLQNTTESLASGSACTNKSDEDHGRGGGNTIDEAKATKAKKDDAVLRLLRRHNARHLRNLAAYGAFSPYCPEVTLRRSCFYLKHDGIVFDDVEEEEDTRTTENGHTIEKKNDIPEGSSSSHLSPQSSKSPNSVSYKGISFYGTPYQPEFYDWAFNLSRERPADEYFEMLRLQAGKGKKKEKENADAKASFVNGKSEHGQQKNTDNNNNVRISLSDAFVCCREAWRTMDTNCDILVSHGPPLGHGDWVLKRGMNRAEGKIQQPNFDSFGCADLLDWVSAFKPRLHVFGHFHDGYGVTTNTQQHTCIDKSNDGDANENDLRNSGTLFINASTCNEAYDPKALRDPIVIEMPCEAIKNKNRRSSDRVFSASNTNTCTDDRKDSEEYNKLITDKNSDSTTCVII